MRPSTVSAGSSPSAMGETGRDGENPQFCDACFSGDYPIALTDHDNGAAPAQLSLLDEQD